MKTHEPIPSDYPIQPLKPTDTAISKATCGYCGLSWDDGKSTSMTPAPSGRCPFEYFHIHREYRCFTRTWWIDNPSWPNGLEPCAGEKHYKRGLYTEDEAIEKCQEWNDSHDPGRYSLKMEFEEA